MASEPSFLEPQDWSEWTEAIPQTIHTCPVPDSNILSRALASLSPVEPVSPPCTDWIQKAMEQYAPEPPLPPLSTEDRDCDPQQLAKASQELYETMLHLNTESIVTSAPLDPLAIQALHQHVLALETRFKCVQSLQTLHKRVATVPDFRIGKWSLDECVDKLLHC